MSRSDFETLHLLNYVQNSNFIYIDYINNYFIAYLPKDIEGDSVAEW